MLDFMKQKKEELKTDYYAALKEAENIATEIAVIDNLIEEYEEEIAEKKLESTEVENTEATGIDGVTV